jgi:hypothetical protein
MTSKPVISRIQHWEGRNELPKKAHKTHQLAAAGLGALGPGQEPKIEGKTWEVA